MNRAAFCQCAAVPKEQLIVFVKARRPGEVKTRIAKTAGAAKACAVYREMVEALLQSLHSLRSIQLRFAPGDARDEIASWLRNDWQAQPQGEGDLGQRLERAFAGAFASGAERVVIIGSDCPEVEASDIRAAWKELKSHDLVLGPAVDGGYWLIGLRAPQPELFREIEWSSDQVLAATAVTRSAYPVLGVPWRGRARHGRHAGAPRMGLRVPAIALRGSDTATGETHPVIADRIYGAQTDSECCARRSRAATAARRRPHIDRARRDRTDTRR